MTMPRHPRIPIVRGLARDCTCEFRKPHGHPHNYNVHACGCEPCLKGATRYKKVGTHLNATGRTRRRAAEPVRRRLELLKERGLTVRQIADESGLSFTNLHLILRSEQPTVTERTAVAVMSVKVPSRRADA